MIRIESLNKQQLSEFINSETYDAMEHIPISRHRAISHINNPRLEADDAILFLAYEQETMVGYLGVLPDRIYLKDRSERCGWLSCLWVNDRYRGKQIAFKLVSKCLDIWQRNILITEFTGPAERLYDKTGVFTPLPEKLGARLYIRSDLHYLLSPKHHLFRKAGPLLKAFDKVFNLFFDVRFRFYPKQIKGIQLDYVNHLDQEVEGFIQQNSNNPLFKRGAEELNWILNYPWILSAPAEDRNSGRYHFSSLARSFSFLPVKVFDTSGEMIAFLVFAKREDRLKLPYCFYSKGNEKAVARVIKHHLVQWRASTFTVFDKSLANTIKDHGTPALWHKSVVRKYLISTDLNKDLPGDAVEIHDGDADCSFT